MDSDAHIRDPEHSGKITCHKCNGFIQEKDLFCYHPGGMLMTKGAHFHKKCYNIYEHYYGLDKGID